MATFNSFRNQAFSFLLFSLLIGCTSSPVKGQSNKEGSGSLSSALERAKDQKTYDAKEFKNIYIEYKKGLHEDVITLTKAFASKYPRSIYLDQVNNIRGLSHVSLKQYDQALPCFKNVLELTQNTELTNMVNYNLAYVHFEQGNLDSAKQFLSAINASDLENNDRYKLHVLSAKVYRVKQNYEQSAEHALSALSLLPESASKQSTTPLLVFLEDVLDHVDNLLILEKFYSSYQSSPAADMLLFKLGQHYFKSKERSRSKPFFEKLVDNYPESSYFTSAKDYLKKADYQGLFDSKKVGIVLSLSGKFSKFGYKALQGIELAFKIFNSTKQDSNPVSLVVIDDQGEVDRALSAIDELYYKHHVAAIIGPLSSKLAEPMGKKAQELGIPLLALSQKEATSGDFVFNTALTPAMQSRELVRFAMDHAKINRFAVLAPSSKFGEEYVKAFWDELEEYQSFVTGYETYPSDETDFRSAVDNLVGLSKPEARGHEVEELQTLKAASPIKVKSKKFDKMFELKPIVDFDAVFIPDEPKTLGQILPTFAYRDVEKVLFLGINTWNSSELIARAGQFAEGSVFVDGFYSGSSYPATQKFIEEYQNTFNTPPSLVEAMAYDAGHILSKLLNEYSIGSRNELKDKLLGLKDFPGISGKISYQNGRLTKQLYFLTVKGGKIEEIAFR